MASHDRERRQHRAISQDNSTRIQKLNDEMRKLKASATKRSKSNVAKLKK